MRDARCGERERRLLQAIEVAGHETVGREHHHTAMREIGRAHGLLIGLRAQENVGIEVGFEGDRDVAYLVRGLRQARQIGDTRTRCTLRL